MSEGAPLADWNGNVMPLAEVRVPALDRGHLLGDGVYEVVRIYDGRLFAMDEHWARLQRSADELRIACDGPALRRRAEALLEASGVREGSLYAQVTRGAGPRTHRFPPKDVAASALFYVTPLGDDPNAEARRRGATAITHPDLRWRRCDVKSLNLLGNVLANQAAYEAGAKEALLVREDGMLTEGSHSNLFVVDDGVLVTTPLGPWILPGITRAIVLGLAREAGLTVAETFFPAARIGEVDEAFVTGTMSEIIPITAVDGKVIGTGEPGAITRCLQEAFSRAIGRKG